MKCPKIFIAILFIILSAFLSLASTSKDSKEKIIFGGGPAGGTFQTIADAIHSFKPVRDATGFKLQVHSSEGSVENLKKINDATLQMGIVYSGDLWQGINGKIVNHSQNPSAPDTSGTNSSAPNSSAIYNKAMAVAYLYSATAQLLVHTEDSEIKSSTESTTGIRSKSAIKNIKDLEGKKIGVGNSGSGAYSSSELFFTHLGLWDKMEKRVVGYNDAARAFRNNELDAFWVFSALPCPAVAMAAAEGKGAKSETDKDAGVEANKSSIAIINLGEDADKSGFLKEFPWFSTMMIRGGTYKGLDQDTLSFQDSAILVASADVSSDTVYQILSIIYADEGVNYLAGQSENLKEMSIQTGTVGIITPLHPGAEKFWKEKGIVK